MPLLLLLLLLHLLLLHIHLQVIGVGGAACKTVQHLWSGGSHNNTLECILVDTDAQALSDSQMPDSQKLLLGGEQNFWMGNSWQTALGYAGLGKVGDAVMVIVQWHADIA